MMTFEELGVSKALTAVLNKRNITAPTPIQQRGLSAGNKRNGCYRLFQHRFGKDTGLFTACDCNDAAGQQIYTDVDTCSDTGACSSGV